MSPVWPAVLTRQCSFTLVYCYRVNSVSCLCSRHSTVLQATLIGHFMRSPSKLTISTVDHRSAILVRPHLKSHRLLTRYYYYGRPLSVSGRPCYILLMFIYFYGRLMLRPRLTEVRESFTRGGPWVWIEKLLLGFFLIILKLQSRPKSDEIWHIFRPGPQTFCSRARTQQNIVIMKKTC